MINQKSKEGSIFCRFLWNHNLIVPATRLDLIQVLRPLFLIEKKCYFSMIWWRRWQCQCQRQAMIGYFERFNWNLSFDFIIQWGRGQHMHLVREKSDWIERTILVILFTVRDIYRDIRTSAHIPMRPQLPTTTLLSNSYLIFNKLDAYLSQVLDVEGSPNTQYNGFSPGNNDSSAYRRLLDDTYIATNHELGSRMRYEASYCGMDEVDNLLSIFLSWLNLDFLVLLWKGD